MFNQKEYNKIYHQNHKEELNKKAIIRSLEWRKNHQKEIKEYRINHKEEIKKSEKKYKQIHKQESKERRKKYIQEHRELIKEQQKKSHIKHKNRINKQRKIWYKNNKSIINEHRREYIKNKLKSDTNFRLTRSLKSRIWDILKRHPKSEHTLKLVGCNIEQLRSYLESKFKTGMSWDNWSLNGWHIDHIRPCASFNLSIPEEQRKCFHYTNLQPLWAKDNIKKSDNFVIGK
jgi:hypothetical protein